MDPVTAAGLGLSVTSLALQLLGGCIKGYGIFIAMTGMPTTYEHLRIRLSLEQARLLSWGDQVGLLEETMEKANLALRLHRSLVVDILSDIHQLFQDCLKIQTKIEATKSYKDISSNPIPSVLPQHGALFAKATRAWEKTGDFPTRLQWALVKQGKFEGLVEKLISYNDSIISLLDRTTIQQIYETQVLSQLTLLQLTSKVDDLHKLVQATQVSSVSPDAAIAQRQDTNGSRLKTSDDFARLANFKVRQMAVESGNSMKNAGLIEWKAVQVIENIGPRSLGAYESNRVWIEWKDYDSENLQVSATTHTRVQKLATLLSLDDTPPEFRAPHCIGYIQDSEEERYGLIFSTPSDKSDIKPKTLLDLINEGRKPSLTQRMALAHVMARSLLYLHAVNWLHKGVRSENIIFLVAPDQKPDYALPIISGFEYARPDLPEELTEKPANNFQHDIYRHPDALGHSDIRSKKSWDIYSLGVVLVEIAFWLPIGEILDLAEGQKGARSRLRGIRDMILADILLEKIAAEVGERYEDVVRRCITGGTSIGISTAADESDPEVAAEMQRVVSEAVVGRLRSVGV